MTQCKKMYLGIRTVFVALLIIFLITPFKTVYAEDSVLKEVKDIVKSYYVYDINEESINNASSIDEILSILNDPYTMYFSSKQYNKYLNKLDNKYSDIGVSVDSIPNGLRVISTVEGSTAAEAGIIPGDIIVEINGRKLENINGDMALGYLRGEEGSIVHIKVLRNNDFIEFDVMRKCVIPSTIDYRILEGNIGYIRISSFGKDTSDEFQNALEYFKKANAANYIVDLRFNPGGYMQSAIDIASYFVGNKIALITNDKIEGEARYYGYSDEVIDKPVIFLVNEYSASASEVLLGTIKDYNKGIIIGTRTYGKGLVQSIFNLSDGSIFKMSVKVFYSPKKNQINKIGINPDIKIKDVDALKAAFFLLKSPSTNVNKTNHQILKIANKSFDIDMNRLKDNYNWKIYSDILRNNSDAQLFRNDKNTWIRIYDFKDKPYKVFYPDYKFVGNIPNAYVFSSFNIMFSRDYLKSTVNNNNIEIVSMCDGSKIPVDIRYINARSICIIPKGPLKPKESYFLLIHPEIKGTNSKSIGGTVTYITVL